MGANNPARQHYIPEFLLRNFLDASGRLWVYDKVRGKVYPTNAKKAFVQNNAYTTYRFEHIEKNAEYEKFVDSITKDYKYEVENFAKHIESKASPVILRIIEKARSSEFPQLSKEQADSWKRFMLTMARRTPESRKRVASASDRDVFYEAAKKRADEVNYDLPDRESLYQDPRILKLRDLEMANVDAKFAAGDSPRERIEEDRFCRETGLRVATIRYPSPRDSFLIGSHGLAIVQSRHTNDAVNGSWLPIAHDVAVSATSARDKEFLLVLDEKSKRVVETINAASDSQSQIIAGRSEELVRSFIVP